MYTHRSRGIESRDTCLVFLFTLATMMTSVFCPRKLRVESRPMSTTFSTSSDRATVGSGVGENCGVGVGVIVSVGVMVGRGGPGVFVHVAVAVDVNVGDGRGVMVSVGVRLGVTEGPAVAVRGSAARTVGRAVRVGDGLAVGWGGAVEAAEIDVGVGLAQHPTIVFKMVTRIIIVASHRMGRIALGRAGLGLKDEADCCDVCICSLSIISLHKNYQRSFLLVRRWQSDP